MKEILFFGDSNTFGYNPENGARLDADTRWTAIASQTVKNEYKITEAGCNNRTLGAKNPSGDLYTGIKIIKNYIRKNTEYAFIQLGINDTQIQYEFTEASFTDSLENFINIIKSQSENCKIILIIPESIKPEVLNCGFRAFFNETSIERSEKLREIFLNVSDKFKLKTFDIAKYATVSKLDGLHYDKNNHLLIGKKISELILNN